MAEGVPFKESNGVMGCGQNDPDRVYDLPVYFGKYEDGLRDIISCWQLTTAEIAEIGRTGKVWLRVMGTGMPPVVIQAKSPFHPA